jgi:hypothetical protein
MAKLILFQNVLFLGYILRGSNKNTPQSIRDLANASSRCYCKGPCRHPKSVSHSDVSSSRCKERLLNTSVEISIHSGEGHIFMCRCASRLRNRIRLLLQVRLRYSGCCTELARDDVVRTRSNAGFTACAFRQVSTKDDLRMRRMRRGETFEVCRREGSCAAGDVSIGGLWGPLICSVP